MANWWNQFGDTYETINQKLGGLPEFIKNVGSKVSQGLGTAENWIESRPVGGPVYAGAQALSNALTGGLQGAISQRIDPASAQSVKELQAKNPIPTGIGAGAGMAGQVLALPAAPVAQAGTAAARILPTLGRNLLTAGVVATPSTVAKGVETGDWTQALKQGLVDTAVGGVLGTGAEKGAALLNPILNKIQLKGMGLSTRDIKQTISQQAKKLGLDKAGLAASQGETLIGKIKDLGNQFGAYTLKGKQALWDFVKGGYTKLSQLYDGAAPKIADVLDTIAARPDLTQARQVFGNKAVDDEILAQAQQISKMDWTNARIHTREMMDSAFRERQPDAIIKLKGAVGGSLHSYLGETAQSLAEAAKGAGAKDVINLADLDAMYGAAKAIHGAESREVTGLPNTFSPNSDTAARLGVQALLGHGLGGVEGLGIAAAGYDPNDPQAMIKAGTKIAMGTLLGRQLNLAASKGAEIGGAQLARGVQAGLGAVQPMAPQIAAAGSKLADVAQNEANAPAQPEIQPPDSGWNLYAGNLSQPVAKQHAAMVQQINSNEQRLSDAQIGDAKQAVSPVQNPNFQTLFEQRVKQLWENDKSPYKQDYEDFLKQAYVSTNNFDPRNEYTAMLLTGRQYKDYLKAYNVALSMQSLGDDLTKAISYGGPGTGVKWALGLMGEQKDEHDRLVNSLYTAMTGKQEEPSPADRKAIESRLVALRGQKLTPGSAKSKLMEMLSTEYGVNWRLLQQYGMI